MAFNVNYWKGTTSSQARAALDYWKQALVSAEDVVQLKTEKQQTIDEFNTAT
jgi:hypothetical protein